MASPVSICNLGLAHLGAEQLISSIDPPDGSAEAGWCATFWPIVLDYVLSGEHSWSFARSRATLAELVSNPSEEWAYAYQLPSNCIRARRILGSTDIEHPEQAGAEYVIEGTTILTNQEDAVLLFTREMLTDETGQFPGDLTTALGMLMASYLAGPILKGTVGMQVGDAWMDRALRALARAAANDANASINENPDRLPGPIKARA